MLVGSPIEAGSAKTCTWQGLLTRASRPDRLPGTISSGFSVVTFSAALGASTHSCGAVAEFNRLPYTRSTKLLSDYPTPSPIPDSRNSPYLLKWNWPAP
jgi:hypothetical protein